MSPTNDGARLYFTSSDSLVGTNQSFRSKLFSWDFEKGVQLVYESPVEHLCCLSITGDGSLAAFTLVTEDSPQRKGALLNLETRRVELVGKTAMVSRNGRYLFNGDALIDRLGGTSRPGPAGAAFVGSDSSLLYKDRDSLHRVDPNGRDRIVMSGLRFSQLRDADENTNTAIVTRPGSAMVVDTVTGRQVDLRTASGMPVGEFHLSSDGQWVTFSAMRSCGALMLPAAEPNGRSDSPRSLRFRQGPSCQGHS